MKRKFFYRSGEAATIVTIVSLVVIGVASFMSSLWIKKTQTTSTKAGTGICRDNPEAPIQGYIWKADCAKSCTSNTDCPQNTDQGVDVNPATSNWCYGFENGFKCLQLRRIDGTPAGSTVECYDNGISAEGFCEYGKYKDRDPSKSVVNPYVITHVEASQCSACIATKYTGSFPRGECKYNNELVCRRGDNHSYGCAGICDWECCAGKTNYTDGPTYDASHRPGSLAPRRVNTGTGGGSQPTTPPANPTTPQANPTTPPVATSTPVPGQPTTTPGQQATTAPTQTPSDFSTKTCMYSEGGKCYQGNCINTAIDCSTNVNCGYVHGRSTGIELNCTTGSPINAPAATNTPIVSGPPSAANTPTTIPSAAQAPTPEVGKCSTTPEICSNPNEKIKYWKKLARDCYGNPENGMCTDTYYFYNKAGCENNNDSYIGNSLAVLSNWCNSQDRSVAFKYSLSVSGFPKDYDSKKSKGIYFLKCVRDNYSGLTCNEQSRVDIIGVDLTTNNTTYGNKIEQINNKDNPVFNALFCYNYDSNSISNTDVRCLPANAVNLPFPGGSEPSINFIFNIDSNSPVITIKPGQG